MWGNSNPPSLGIFLSMDVANTWKQEQVAYYANRKSLKSASKWTQDLIQNLMKIAWGQWDHPNEILHKTKLKPIKDTMVNNAIIWQYEVRPWGLPLPPTQDHTLQLPHSEKKQWVTSLCMARKWTQWQQLTQWLHNGPLCKTWFYPCKPKYPNHPCPRPYYLHNGP